MPLLLKPAILFAERTTTSVNHPTERSGYNELIHSA